MSQPSDIVSCPRCATKFRVTDKQLAVANGRVRCGACLTVFDARDGTSASNVDASSTSDAIPATELQELTSAEAARPVLGEVSSSWRRRRVLAAEDLDEPLTDQERKNLDLLLDEPQVLAMPKRNRLQIVFVVVFVGVALVAQYIYFRFGEIAQNPDTRAALETLCAFVGCTVPPFRSVNEIRAQAVLTEPPEKPEFIVMRVELKNLAPLPQAYPDLRVRLLDRYGRVLVTRSFAPSEYRRGELSTVPLLPIGRSVIVELEMLKPVTVVSNYEFEVVDAP